MNKKPENVKQELEKEEPIVEELLLTDVDKTTALKKSKVTDNNILSKALSTTVKTESLLPKYTDDLMETARNLVNSGILPDGIKKPETVIAIIQKGKEMGFLPMTSFEHIVIINGKASLDGAAIGAVLKRGKVDWEVIKNAEKQYVTDLKGNIIQYVTGKKDGKTVQIPATEEHIKKGLETKPKLVDVVTQIKFYRKSSVIQNKIIEHISEFTYKDAKTADLLDKDVWKKYLKSMLFWRCLSIGGRQIAPDLLFGMPSAEEIDESGKIGFNESGKIIKI